MRKSIRNVFFFLCMFAASASAQAADSSDSAALRQKFVAEVKKYIGTPYERGGIGPDSFDCSGLVFTAARDSTGYQLPRTAKAIYEEVTIISDSDRQEGDLVFFRTTGDGSISHVGVFIGGGKFVHAVSDGANTGVIASSLDQDSWKSCYAGTGRFLPAAPAAQKQETDIPVKQTSAAAGAAVSSGNFGPFTADAGITGDWSFFTPSRFMLNPRGLTLYANLSYVPVPLEPGIALLFRYDAGTTAFQLPVVVTLKMNDYLRMYAGPVISFGKAVLPDSSTEIKESVFPGIIGLSWQTPRITIADCLLTFTQDIFYIVYNDMEGAALTPADSLATGLVFATGIRVTLPQFRF